MHQALARSTVPCSSTRRAQTDGLLREADTAAAQQCQDGAAATERLGREAAEGQRLSVAAVRDQQSTILSEELRMCDTEVVATQCAAGAETEEQRAAFTVHEVESEVERVVTTSRAAVAKLQASVQEMAALQRQASNDARLRARQAEERAAAQQQTEVVELQETWQLDEGHSIGSPMAVKPEQLTRKAEELRKQTETKEFLQRAEAGRSPLVSRRTEAGRVSRAEQLHQSRRLRSSMRLPPSVPLPSPEANFPTAAEPGCARVTAQFV